MRPEGSESKVENSGSTKWAACDLCLVLRGIVVQLNPLNQIGFRVRQ